MAEDNGTPASKQGKEARKRTWPRGASERTLWRKIWDRTGLRGKTLWDWLELLIIPFMLVVVGFWFTMQQDVRQQALEDQRAEAERQLEEQRTQDTVLQAYLDQMTTLILDRQLLESDPSDTVFDIARARTTTAITSLDAKHNISLTRFLTEAGLTGRSIPLLQFMDLEGADLAGADLIAANLPIVKLADANLRGAFLMNANLRGANLSNADLRDTNLAGADLSSTTLGEAIGYPDYSGADATTDLTGANLTGADLTQVNLTGTKVTQEQLATCKSLEGTIMPDGSKHD